MIHVLDKNAYLQQHLLHLHESVVAKQPAKIVFYVSTRQEEFKTFKGVKIDKLRDWPPSVSVIGIRVRPMKHLACDVDILVLKPKPGKV